MIKSHGHLFDMTSKLLMCGFDSINLKYELRFHIIIIFLN